MIDLDRRYGIWSGRVWGLIVNLLANALALYGLVGFLAGRDPRGPSGPGGPGDRRLYPPFGKTQPVRYAG